MTVGETTNNNKRANNFQAWREQETNLSTLMANVNQTVLGTLNKAVSDTSGARAYDTKYATYLNTGASFK